MFNNLLKATKKGNLQAVEKLLAKGADPNKKVDFLGLTPLIYAAMGGHTEIARALIDKGAKLDTKGATFCDTALLWAIAKNHTDIAHLLIDKGADIEERNTNGYTPLMCAAHYGREKVLQTLIEKGATLNRKDTEGRTALDYAAFKVHPGAIQIIQDALKEQKQSAEEKLQPVIEPWVKLDSARVAYVGVYQELQKKMTEIFNFESRERLIIFENLKTGAETMLPPTRFDDLAQNAIEKALEQFTRLGGEADEGIVLRNVHRLDKKSPGF